MGNEVGRTFTNPCGVYTFGKGEIGGLVKKSIKISTGLCCPNLSGEFQQEWPDGTRPQSKSMICHGSREGEARLHNIKSVRGVAGFAGSTTSGKTARIRNISLVGAKKITIQGKNCRGGR
jgi:hypothetical protein